MNRFNYLAASIVLLAALAIACIFAARAEAATFCNLLNGCTGTSTIPAYGQILIGGRNGEYEYIASSTLAAGGGVSGLAATYQLLSTGTTGSVAISTAFSTTTANTWSQLQTLNSGVTVNGISTLATTTLIAVDKGGMVYNVKAFGAKCDGVTDDTVAINATIAAAMSTSTAGGAVYIPGHCLALGALNFPYTSQGGFQPIQNPVRITGNVSTVNTYWTSNYTQNIPAGSSVLDLRYAGGDGFHVAKIDTRGGGTMEIDHLVIESGGTDSYPIMQTTNTTVFIHDIAVIGNSAATGTNATQNFLQMGGYGNLGIDDSNAGFQGYGSSLRDDFFTNIHHIITYGNDVNETVADNLQCSFTCGSSTTPTRLSISILQTVMQT
jgi:hypothetical protein